MATGDTLAVFGAGLAQFPGTNYPQYGGRNNQLSIDYDPTTQETAYFEGVLPRNYSGAGITVRLSWVSLGTTGNVVWGAAFERHDTATDLDADSFGGVLTTTTAVPGTSGFSAYTDIAFTNGAQIDSLSVGESFRLSIARIAANGSDTNTNDAQLRTVELRET